jgi:hypothetical protein
MTDATVQAAACRQGYEAALRDLEQRVAKLQEWGEAGRLGGVLAELRTGVTGRQPLDMAVTKTTGIPSDELEREWTAG